MRVTMAVRPEPSIGELTYLADSQRACAPRTQRLLHVRASRASTGCSPRDARPSYGTGTGVRRSRGWRDLRRAGPGHLAHGWSAGRRSSARFWLPSRRVPATGPRQSASRSAPRSSKTVSAARASAPATSRFTFPSTCAINSRVWAARYRMPACTNAASAVSRCPTQPVRRSARAHAREDARRAR